MEFVYRRAQPGNPEGPFFDTTEIVFPKNEDMRADDIDFDNSVREQFERLLPEHANALPYDDVRFPERIILSGIVHRRVIFRLLRGENAGTVPAAPQAVRMPRGTPIYPKPIQRVETNDYL